MLRSRNVPAPALSPVSVSWPITHKSVSSSLVRIHTLNPLAKFPEKLSICQINSRFIPRHEHEHALRNCGVSDCDDAHAVRPAPPRALRLHSADGTACHRRPKCFSTYLRSVAPHIFEQVYLAYLYYSSSHLWYLFIIQEY